MPAKPVHVTLASRPRPRKTLTFHVSCASSDSAEEMKNHRLAREILNSIQKYVREILLRYKFSKKAKKLAREITRCESFTFNLFSFPSNLSFILHDFFFVSKDFSQNTAKTGRKGISSVKRRLSCQKGRGGRAAELLLVRE